MDDFYREMIVDHYRYPRNHGMLPDPDISHEEHNPVCGDQIRIDIKLDGERVAKVGFSGHGCAISQASASMLTDMIAGKTLDEVKQVSKDESLEGLGFPLGPVRLKCALLSLKALKVGVYGTQTWDGDDDEL
ncbi:MAG TPA: SUF system NifU family Fe-S cluster assembly protein [Ardenticatenaceae bacterium]|nr:SUF system NifU family Fe-S cluster assembly protein [Ardenticatenaceae bacterium]